MFSSTKTIEKKFLQASASGNIAEVKRLRGWGAGVYCKEEHTGLSALHFAAKNGHIEMIQCLLQLRIKPTIADNDGSTPLFSAAEYGHEAAVRLLLNSGAAVNMQNKYQTTAIHLAARNGHTAVVDLLLKSQATFDSKAIFGSTPLHDAAANGHKAVVELLIKSGADVNSKDKYERTPLHKAAWKGSRSVVELLLVAGASLDSKDKDGKTPLQVAQEGKGSSHANVVKMFQTFDPLKHSQPNAFIAKPLQTPLLPSRDVHVPKETKAVVPNEQSIPVSKEQSAPVQQKPKPATSAAAAPPKAAQPTQSREVKKYTPTRNELDALEKAIKDGYIGEVSKYIDLGIDPNTTNETGDSFLHLAIKANQDGVVEYFLSMAGIDTNVRNQDDMTPLILAIKLGHRRLANQIYVVSRPSIAAIDMPEDAIVIDYTHSLGAGAFGSVYRGFVNGEEVAVKSAHKGSENMLLQEISTMTKCRSPYIVDVVAISREANTSPKLALQYMDCGDLRQYLNAKREKKPTPIQFTSLEVAWVVANALADLHHNSTLHRDLKSNNILLSTKNYIKLGDLGISRELTQNTMTQAGTPLWEAPEVLRGERYDYAADIYSFGVILTELDTLELPYSNVRLKNLAFIAQIREGLLKPSLSPSCEPWLKELALMCLSFEPGQRPSAHKIVDFLRAEMRSPTKAKVIKPVLQPSYSSAASTSTSSHSEFGVTTLSKWTQIPCPKCNTKNHITARECVGCSSTIRAASDKLSIMLKRLNVAKRDRADISLTLECLFCCMPNDFKSQVCEHCEEELQSDDDKIAELATRLEAYNMTTTA